MMSWMRAGWLMAATWFLTCSGCAQLPADGIAQIRQADQAYKAANYTESARHATAVIGAYPDHPATAEAYYIRGLTHLKRGDRVAARRDLDAAAKRGDRRDLNVKVQAQLGHLYFDEDRYQRALGHYRLSARAGWDEIVCYRLAIASQRSGRFAEGRRALKRLVNSSPSGRYADSALQKLRWKHDYFSVQCGVFSNSERAYSAAAALQANGATIAVVRDVSADEARYVVLAGKYRDYPSAVSALKRFKSEVPDAFLVP